MSMKKYISWSGGKDSTATIILAHLNNIQIDKIVISLPMFDKKEAFMQTTPNTLIGYSKKQSLHSKSGVIVWMLFQAIEIIFIGFTRLERTNAKTKTM